MNGKNILIGLSYIDRKYIEESEEDVRPEKVVRNSKRMPTRSKVKMQLSRTRAKLCTYLEQEGIQV